MSNNKSMQGKVFKVSYANFNKVYICGTMKDVEKYFYGYYKKYADYIKGKSKTNVVVSPIFDKILYDNTTIKHIIDKFRHKLSIKSIGNEKTNDNEDTNEDTNEDNNDDDNDDDDDDNDDDNNDNTNEENGKINEKIDFKKEEISKIFKVLKENINIYIFQDKTPITDTTTLHMIQQAYINKFREKGICLNKLNVFNPDKKNSFEDSTIYKIVSEDGSKTVICWTTANVNKKFNEYKRNFAKYEKTKVGYDSIVYEVLRLNGTPRYEIIKKLNCKNRAELLAETQKIIDNTTCINRTNVVQDPEYQANYAKINREKKTQKNRERQKMKKIKAAINTSTSTSTST
jgi:hypothetical protein